MRACSGNRTPRLNSISAILPQAPLPSNALLTIQAVAHSKTIVQFVLDFIGLQTETEKHTMDTKNLFFAPFLSIGS